MHGVMRACYGAGGDDLTALRTFFLHELRRVVAFDAAFMAACDPETLLFTAAFAEDPLTESAPLFLDNEFSTAPDVNRFADLALSADPVASLDQATGGERGASPRSREIMAPLGMGDEARAALRVDGTTWGFLCLHRSGPLGFDHTDLAALRRVAPHVGEAIRRIVAATSAGDEPRSDARTQGLVIVAHDRVVALGGAAEYWLEQLGYPFVVIGDPLPLALAAVVRRLSVLEGSGLTGPPAAVRLRTSRGVLLTVHATALRDAAGAGAVALSIVRTDSAEHASLLLAAHGLTPAQRRVAELVLQGRTTGQIVRQLRISEHTVQDHLKAVFDKIGVRSRRDLVAVLMRAS